MLPTGGINIFKEQEDDNILRSLELKHVSEISLTNNFQRKFASEVQTDSKVTPTAGQKFDNPRNVERFIIKKKVAGQPVSSNYIGFRKPKLNTDSSRKFDRILSTLEPGQERITNDPSIKNMSIDQSRTLGDAKQSLISLSNRQSVDLIKQHKRLSLIETQDH